MQIFSEESQEFQIILSQIIAKTWLDEDLNSRFLANTNVVLEENGLPLPGGVEFQVKGNILVGTSKSASDSSTGEVVYEIPLPTKPTGLTEQVLQSWASEDNSEMSIDVHCRGSM
ncbi:MAG: hypothetical protein F6K36_04885 [Symploca sp. SIO3C6]|uniref:NHLP leader peptide family natural product n=1 Tax=Symploca sp. SIO1C4 TaxID=2607765 RepID=A0A6B3MZV5_9CYAN|nr:hypothetical protein [Symploca sp. SIO3C6]NER26966.1 hypothetical protein [Symploca sp. SIO1C4]